MLPRVARQSAYALVDATLELRVVERLRITGAGGGSRCRLTAIGEHLPGRRRAAWPSTICPLFSVGQRRSDCMTLGAC